MQALTVIPGIADSGQLDDVAEPPADDGPVLVETLAIGVCGTDTDILAGKYGWAPKGRERLILGHESLGRVVEAPGGSGLAAGDLVVGIVRRPDPVPCSNCAVGEWDMCRNGKYTERGIKERDGYASERYRIEPEFAVKVDPALSRHGVLLEPVSVLAKAWEQVAMIGARTHWEPHRALIIGAGPIGLLAALMGRRLGLDVHVLDRITTGPKPGLVEALGATYHTGKIKDMGDPVDVVIECTGVGQLVFDAIDQLAPGGIMCLTGVSSGGRTLPIDAGSLNRQMVLANEVVFGSVNANRRHYDEGAKALVGANPDWLEQIISRRVPIKRWQEALKRQADDVKPIIILNGEE